MKAVPSVPEEGAACAVRLEPERHDALHPDLDHWRSNVGKPVVLDLAPAAPSQLAGIDVLCWNVAIGMGDLSRVLDCLRGPRFHVGLAPERPLIVLIQEAFRSGTTVPERTGSVHHGGPIRERSRHDIVTTATSHALSLRYSPSMRNGAHRSDRGNAILSSAALDGAHAFLLPHVRQRRVAVSARLAGHDRLHFASAHLDTRGRPQRAARAHWLSSGRATQALALGHGLAALSGSLVLGADLNSYLGLSDPALRALLAAGLHSARRVGTWRHTFHSPLRLLLDHVLYRSADDRIADVDVIRIDEAPGDRSAGVFGSDHHPLLARIALRT